MRSRARRSPRRIIRSAPSIRTWAWCRCRIRAGEARRHRASGENPADHGGIRRHRGLVAGASKGEGLGNKFLAHIREVDAIAHVVRCFENDDIIHVAGKIDPANDIEVINTELALADLDSVERAYQKALKAAKTADKDAVKLRDLLERVREQLNKAKPVRSQVRRQRASAAARHAPAHRQAGDVRGECRREWLHRQPAPRSRARDRRRRRARWWCRCARRSRRRSRSSTRRTGPTSLKELKLDEPGLNRVIRGGYSLLGPADLFHRRPQRSARLDGACGPPRRRPRA
jgi:hypothetical protein